MVGNLSFDYFSDDDSMLYCSFRYRFLASHVQDYSCLIKQITQYVFYQEEAAILLLPTQRFFCEQVQ